MPKFRNRRSFFLNSLPRVAAPDEPILLPTGSDQVDYEAELAVVIGRRAKNIVSETRQWITCLATRISTTFPPAICSLPTANGSGANRAIRSLRSVSSSRPKMRLQIRTILRIQFRLNGETMQDSTNRELIFRIPELVEYLSRSITLEPGDIIATGTPPGVGFARKPPVFLKDGDVCEVEIEGLGVLINSVSTG